eukprot:7000357-Prymnesium_polylepis.1
MKLSLSFHGELARRPHQCTVAPVRVPARRVGVCRVSASFRARRKATSIPQLLVVASDLPARGACERAR